jgi:signal transduction histidine kinase
LILLATGPSWLDGPAAPIRFLGGLLIADGCFAAGIGGISHGRSQFRAARWFAAGHVAAITVFLFLQDSLVGPSLDFVVQSFLIVVTVSSYLWITTNQDGHRDLGLIRLFETRPAATDVRSTYEEQIRKAAAQEERNRLARDLHDAIKQQVFAIQTSAATAQTRFDSDSAGTMEALDRVRDSAREVMTELEAMLDQLRASPLENVGLTEALHKLCEATEHRTGARVHVDMGELPPSTSVRPGAHEAILRVAQEALANAARHARATDIVVRLHLQSGRIRLSVRDDGSGFNTSTSGNGMGLANMRARAEEFGGELEVTSRPDAGTAVEFSVPYATTDPEEHRDRMILLAVLLVLQIALFLDHMSMISISLLIIAPIAMLREMIAYRRARANAE